MANVKRALLTLAVQGMNSSVNAVSLQPTAAARLTNCQIKNQLVTTRPGVRSHKLGHDADEFRKLNIQGAMHYNPVFGQSQQVFGRNTDSIIISAGGRKFHLTFGSGGLISISDETAALPGIKDAHLVWMFQAENYAIVQDGVSGIWIWDGDTEAFSSPGYNEQDPQSSRIANAATAGLYAHGRIVQVIKGNRIIVGDIIHKTLLTESSNILNMTEQVYYATGSFFSPPSNMGEIVGMGILPLSNTMHGHDDVIIHCRRGIYSLKIDHFPRSEWPTEAVSKHLLLDSSAVGPYALCVYDGDQMFRSRVGIQSIRSAAQNANLLGNPNLPISEPVECFLKSDNHTLLKFASMAKWGAQHRIFCTTGLWMNGMQRGGRGFVSLNLNPDGSATPDTIAWEGLWTLHEQAGRPSQLVNAQFGDDDKLIVLSTRRECDGSYTNVVNELDETLTYDVLEDGTISPISCQCISSKYPTENIFKDKSFWDGTVCFVNVIGDLDWGVWARNDETDPWTLWKTGKFSAANPCETGCWLTGPKSYRLDADIGDAPESVKRGKYLQFLVRWRGYASVEAIALGFEEEDGKRAPVTDNKKVVEIQTCGDYSDYEYTSTENRWEDQE